MPPEPAVSIIIPVVDEADSLRAVILALQADANSCEIIVVDGSSSDDSAQVAAGAGARVIQSRRRQRAHQLNLGAQHARAAVLLFLHADTIVPAGALQSLVEALQDREIAGGAFARRYASRSVVLRFTCYAARWRNRLIGWHLGDQAMFVRRAAFFQLGGFREVDQFEDLDFSRRLRRFGRTITLSSCVLSSARRFEADGASATTFRDLRLTLRYLRRGFRAANTSSTQRVTASPRRSTASVIR